MTKYPFFAATALILISGHISPESAVARQD
jgi:hypothetical protein